MLVEQRTNNVMFSENKTSQAPGEHRTSVAVRSGIITGEITSQKATEQRMFGGKEITE